MQKRPRNNNMKNEKKKKDLTFCQQWQTFFKILLYLITNQEQVEHQAYRLHSSWKYS